MFKTLYVQPGGGFDKIIYGESEPKTPASHEITVRLKANSLNYHDYVVVSGVWGPSAPRIPLSDGAGEVTAIGEGVTDFEIGDHVVSTFFPTWLEGEPEVDGFATVPGDGIDGYARQGVTMAASAFTHAPKNYSHAEAATLTTAGLTAWRALMADGRLKPGDSVLVQGTGGVSIFALQFAKLAGATVIATSSKDEKLARLQQLGADHVINYQKDPNWGETARKMTNGRGVDYVIEVGGPSTLEQSMMAAKVGGHIAVIGILSGIAGPISVVSMLIRQLRLQGVLVGSRRHQLEMIKAIEANSLRPVIDRHFPLKDLVAAFRYQETNQHFGKICIDID